MSRSQNKEVATTGCVCKTPGYCQRHKCQKTAHWHHLCQTRPDYFALWEAGHGPGQTVPVGKGLGDFVERVFQKVGITPERYVAVKGALGLKKKCGCHKRKKLLNDVGKWLVGQTKES